MMGGKVGGFEGKIRNEGGGFAANIYGAMPAGLWNDRFPVSSAFSNDLFDRK